MVLCLLLGVAPFGVLAQEATPGGPVAAPVVVACGLNNPRGLAWDGAPTPRPC